MSPTMPRHQPKANVQLNVDMLQQVPGGWVVLHYSLSPKQHYAGLAFPMVWGGPDNPHAWNGSMGGQLPEGGKVFESADEARDAMRAAGLTIRAEDDNEQLSMF